MTDEHKAALAEGRRAGQGGARPTSRRSSSTKPKRGRKRTPESIRKQLDKIDAELDDADPVKKLQLIQDRIDLEAELEAIENKPDLTALEADFVAAAAGLQRAQGHLLRRLARARRRGRVLKRAGISRAS